MLLTFFRAYSMKHLFRLFAAIFASAVLLPAAGNAKDKPVAEAIWSGASIEYEFVKDYELELDYENRCKLNDDKAVTNLVDLGISHDFSKNLVAGLVFRLRCKQGDTDFEWKPYVTGKYKIIDPLTLSARLMYHHEYDKNDHPEEYARIRLMAEYEFSKSFSAKIRTEAFYHFAYDEGDRFDKTRSGIELEYKIIKPLSIALFWQYDNEFNENKNQDSRIFGLNLGYKFK